MRQCPHRNHQYSVQLALEDRAALDPPRSPECPGTQFPLFPWHLLWATRSIDVSTDLLQLDLEGGSAGTRDTSTGFAGGSGVPLPSHLGCGNVLNGWVRTLRSLVGVLVDVDD